MKHRIRLLCTIVVAPVCQHCVTTLDAETPAPIASVFSAPSLGDHSVALELPRPIAPGVELRGALTWRSGSAVQFGQVLWLPSQALLLFDPFEPLDPDLVYSLHVSDLLALDDGTTLRVPELTSAQVIALPEVAELPAANVDTTRTIAELLGQTCGSCHNNQPLPSLDASTLFSVSTSDANRPLVEPTEPAQSVLIDRIIHHLPRRSGQVMPPAWSDSSSLTPEQVQRVEAWILAGCPDSL